MTQRTAILQNDSSTIVRPGDTMTFKVGVQNNNALFGTPCDITGANIGFRLAVDLA